MLQEGVEWLRFHPYGGWRSVSRKQLRIGGQHENALPQRLYQLRKLCWGVSVPWSTGKNRIPHQPDTLRQFKRDTPRCVSGQMVNAHVTRPVAHVFAVFQQTVGYNGQEFGVRGVHSNRRVCCLMQFQKRACVVTVSMGQQDGGKLGASDRTEKRFGVSSGINNERMCLATEEDVAIGLVLSNRKAQHIHVKNHTCWPRWESSTSLEKRRRRWQR